MSVSKCKARTKLGEFCKARPTRNGFCSIHSDPERAAELGRKSGECRRLSEGEPVILLPPKTAGDLGLMYHLAFEVNGAVKGNTFRFRYPRENP